MIEIVPAVTEMVEKISPDPTRASFSNEQLETLQLVGEIDVCTTEDIAIQLDISNTKAEFYLNEWIEIDAVGGAYTYGGGDTTYYLTQAGRKILFDHGLLD